MGAEQSVREAAAALLHAVSLAKAEGLSIQWPTHPEGLASLAISQTGRVAAGGFAHSDEGGAVAELAGEAGEPLNPAGLQLQREAFLATLSTADPIVRGRMARTSKK